MKERIQKVLANAGVDSRRNIEQMVLDGRVQVNGKVVRQLPILVDPENDKIHVDGEPIKFKPKKGMPEKVYILMNKPKGVYCTNVAQGVQKRAIDLLPPDFPYRVYPVGRLDAESRGLLLLTNDGDLTNRLTHPRYGIAKTYVAEVDGYVEDRIIEELNKGVWLADKQGKGFKAGASKVKIMNRGRQASTLEITICEGRNRQIRRMLAALGHKVKKLQRIRMGKLTLKGVGPGNWRFLTPIEVKQLKREAQRAAGEVGEVDPKKKPGAKRPATGKPRKSVPRKGQKNRPSSAS